MFCMYVSLDCEGLPSTSECAVIIDFCYRGLMCSLFKLTLAHTSMVTFLYNIKAYAISLDFS